MIAQPAEAPVSLPAPMTDREASTFARQAFRNGVATRRGRACLVGVRTRARGRTVRNLGIGATWEKAFDVALRNEGR